MPHSMQLPPVICLMGPTASGKTALAVELVRQFPCDIVSVDSAMVYRGMDIGTAKPGQEILEIAPHRLIDIADPSEPYSAGQFRTDALREINAIHTQGRIPLLVGGTMLYFQVLRQGLATLPTADATIRAALQARANEQGWGALHAELATIDPAAAKRIHARDSQRIQRALEVYQLTGKTMSAWQSDTHALADYTMHYLALIPKDRALLHERIAIRFELMLKLGFVAEVQALQERGDLSAELPSMRSVGYKQIWQYLAGQLSYEDMRTNAITATRQLAKRQFTWLRSWPDLVSFTAEEAEVAGKVRSYVAKVV